MNARFDALVDMIQGAVRNPAADLSTTALLLVGVSLIGLVLVVFLLLLATPKQRKIMRIRTVQPRNEDADTKTSPEAATEGASGAPHAASAIDDAVTSTQALAHEDVEPGADQEQDAGPVVAPTPSPVSAIVGFALSVPVLLVLAAVSGYIVTGTDTVCAGTCHAQQESVATAHKQAHASCASCHEVPGLTGVPRNVVSRVSMAASWAVGKRAVGDTVVSSRSCASCHSDVLDGVTRGSEGVRMSHAEPIQGGMTCTGCHSRTGHSTSTSYSMSSCLPCHDGRSAPSECSSCHVEDPYTPKRAEGETSATAFGSGRTVFPVVKVRNTDCGGCHDQERQCDTCHGLRMPHPPEFVARDHAKAAAFEKKQACNKCHTPDSCSSGCHIGFPGHGDNWKQAHQRMPRDAVCGCHAARTGRTEPMCVLCHDF